MAVLSPIMSYIVDKEIGFPIPSEKEKINKALKRYRNIFALHPERSDSPEIMFGIADLLVGRGNPGDHAEAVKLYDQILLKNPPEYLKARALIGKAELLIGIPEEFGNAISLCEKSRQILGKDISDFFAAKTYIVEAELRLARRDKGDWANALQLINQVVKEKNAHWYFRGRALLSKAEIILYRDPDELASALKLCDFALKELKSRPDDYFANKGKIVKAEILARRAKKIDFEKAEKLLTEVIKMPFAYKDLIARAKLDLADIVNHPKAAKLLKEVHEMEGLDPYLIEKASLIEQAIKERPGK
jgi:tetratricopeptide (TPR) repeat protein